ncbi:MAG: inosine/xanthosine triphosphatase [Euryarchaeota archaeon]|nr:inosine/xanthosine triphosphatase [Euryarchaeota archaeon]
MRVCLGGTFDHLHAGHVALLAKAFQVGDEVFIGVSSQRMAQRHRARRVKPFSARKAGLEALLRRKGWKGIVSEIDDPYGRSIDARYQGIVVSPETLPRVIEINRERRKRGYRFLKVFVIPFFYGEDGLRISSTRIAKKETDAKGRRLTAVRVAVGTHNALKVRAVADAFADAFPSLRVKVRGVRVKSGVPEQPTEAETFAGAENRARRALAAWPGADYGVGVEAGLLASPYLRRHLDVQYVVVVDKEGGLSAGHGGGFYYPRGVEERVLRGKTISDVMGPIARDPRLGSTTGAVGFLSRGAIDRRELTRHAVLLALVPRVRRDLYQE